MKTYIKLEKDGKEVKTNRRKFLATMKALEEEEKNLHELRMMSQDVDKIFYEEQEGDGKCYLKLLYEEDREFKEESYRLRVDAYARLVIRAFWESELTS